MSSDSEKRDDEDLGNSAEPTKEQEAQETVTPKPNPPVQSEE